MNGGCAVANGAIICSPRRAISRVVQRCPECKAKFRGAFYNEGYYGVRLLLQCGHTWADGEWWPHYQGVRHREATATEVRSVWRMKLPPLKVQEAWLWYYMGIGKRPPGPEASR